MATAAALLRFMEAMYVEIDPYVQERTDLQDGTIHPYPILPFMMKEVSMDVSLVSAYRQAIEPSGRSAQRSAEILPPEKFQPVPPIVEAGKAGQKVHESAIAVRALALRQAQEASTANAVASLVKPDVMGYTSSGAVADAIKTVGNYINTLV